MENREVENKKIALLVKILLWLGVGFFVLQILGRTGILDHGINLFHQEIRKELQEIRERTNVSLLNKTNLPEDALSHLNGRIEISSKEGKDTLFVDFILIENKVFLKESGLYDKTLFPGYKFLESKNEWYFFEVSKEDLEAIKQSLETVSQKNLVQNIKKTSEGEFSFLFREREFFSAFYFPTSEAEKEELEKYLSTGEGIWTTLFVDIQKNFIEKIIFDLENLTVTITFGNFQKEGKQKENLEIFVTEKLEQITHYFLQQ